jgi:hypothetical protein
MERRQEHATPIPAPGTGGYEFEVVELGPPEYLTPMPPAKSRGKLIPMGDGEGLPVRPAPPLARRKRSSRSRRQIAQLRRWVSEQVQDLRRQIERLKAVTEYPDLRTTFEEF